MNRSIFSAFALFAVAACGPADALVDEGDDFAEASAELTLSAADAAKVLALVNYPGTELSTLDGPAGLDARAARGIISRRDGPDARSPSRDDVPYTTLAALDAVPYVGSTVFQKLLVYANAHPAPAAIRVEGVNFEGWQAEIVLWGLNTVPIGVLNGLLDNRAAQNLFTARPFASLTNAANVPLVSTNALEALRGQATTWWAARRSQTQPAPAAVVVDGVSFELSAATVALDIANRATKEQLTAHGVYATGANAIIAGRPFAGLPAVGALSGVGAATMEALRAWAASGSWTAPAPVAPVQSVAEARTLGEAAFRKHINEVLFSSDPAGASFRQAILEWRPQSEWPAVQQRMLTGVTTYFTTELGSGDTGATPRETPTHYAWEGAIIGLYTELAVDKVTREVRVYIEID